MKDDKDLKTSVYRTFMVAIGMLLMAWVGLSVYMAIRQIVLALAFNGSMAAAFGYIALAVATLSFIAMFLKPDKEEEEEETQD